MKGIILNIFLHVFYFIFVCCCCLDYALLVIVAHKIINKQRK